MADEEDSADSTYRRVASMLRVYSRRSEAQKACKGGKGERQRSVGKPHRSVQPGDEISIGRPYGTNAARCGEDAREQACQQRGCARALRRQNASTHCRRDRAETARACLSGGNVAASCARQARTAVAQAAQGDWPEGQSLPPAYWLISSSLRSRAAASRAVRTRF
jgi:ribosomal 50S subunit-recycling heat shock protein